MKTSVTLTFDNHILENIKKKFTGKSLSNFTNSLYAAWLEAKKKEELIAAYKRIAKSKVYKEVEKSMEGVSADWFHEIEKYEDESKKRVS